MNISAKMLHIFLSQKRGCHNYGGVPYLEELRYVCMCMCVCVSVYKLRIFARWSGRTTMA